MAHLCDHGVDLVAGKLSAFAGLGALRHLDLHHVGVDEMLRGHAKRPEATCLILERIESPLESGL